MNNNLSSIVLSHYFPSIRQMVVNYTIIKHHSNVKDTQSLTYNFPHLFLIQSYGKSKDKTIIDKLMSSPTKVYKITIIIGW